MPISLPLASRRTFLQQSLAMGGGLIAFESAWGTEDTGEEYFALLADTHIPASRTEGARGQVMADNLAKVVRGVLDRPSRPQFALIDGDCARNDGQPGDYRLLAELLQPWIEARLPVHMTLGNHDNREVFRDALARHVPTETPVPSKHVTVIKSRHVNWFLVDTLWKVNVVTGEIGDEQLKWLGQALTRHADKPAIVVGHHTPQFDVPPNTTIGGIRDSVALFDLLDGLRHVQAYVFGHSHRWNVERRPSGLHLINLPAVGYAFDNVQPLGWVDAVPTAGGMKLQLHSLLATHPEQGQWKELIWRT